MKNLIPITFLSFYQKLKKTNVSKPFVKTPLNSIQIVKLLTQFY